MASEKKSKHKPTSKPVGKGGHRLDEHPSKKINKDCFVGNTTVKGHLDRIAPIIAKYATRRRDLALAKDTYLTDSKVDLKSIDKDVRSLQDELDLLRSTFRSLAGKLQTLHIGLMYLFANTSSAASAQAFVNGVIPSNSGEFSSLSALFDEFICDSVEVWWDCNVQNSNTAQTHAAIAYDPINAGSYGSVTGVMEASQFDGPIHTVNATQASNPLNHTRTGMWHKHFRMPKGPEVRDPNTPSVLGTGMWTSTSTTGTVYGYIKGYVEAASGSLTTTSSVYMKMHCRFRSRT